MLCVEVDMSKTPPAFKVKPQGLAKRFSSEYREWVTKTIVPVILEICTTRQLMALAKKGKAFLKKSIDKHPGLK